MFWFRDIGAEPGSRPDCNKHHIAFSAICLVFTSSPCWSTPRHGLPRSFLPQSRLDICGIAISD
jgi:hypothetical protein